MSYNTQLDVYRYMMGKNDALKFKLYMLCLDGGILSLNIETARSRAHICNALMDYNRDGVMYICNLSNGRWIRETMDETRHLEHENLLPNWLRTYLLLED